MPVGTINKSTVDALRPGPKDAYLWDGRLNGFGVKVTPTGAKVYLVQYRHLGRVRRYTIGKHGAITPDQAKEQARRLILLINQGNDPQAAKEQKRHEAVDLAFDKVAQRFLEVHGKKGSQQGSAHHASHALAMVPEVLS